MKKRASLVGTSEEPAKTMGVEIYDSLRRRLKRYLADHEPLTIKGLVNEAIDDYLKKRGA